MRTMLRSILRPFLSWLRTIPTDAVFVVIRIVDIGSAATVRASCSSTTEAIRAGADHLVVGRPITLADDPVAAFNAIAEELRTRVSL